MHNATLTTDSTLLGEIPLERLEADITGFASRIAAATAQWLLWIAAYDRCQGWVLWQTKSCAHWLNWHCGISPRTARQHVAVAHKLTTFDQLRSTFLAGELSYSKVRAIASTTTASTKAAGTSPPPTTAGPSTTRKATTTTSRSYDSPPQLRSPKPTQLSPAPANAATWRSPSTSSPPKTNYKLNVENEGIRTRQDPSTRTAPRNRFTRRTIHQLRAHGRAGIHLPHWLCQASAVPE